VLFRSLAVTVRVLVHDTSMRSSLLQQMNVKHQMRLIDSNGGIDARGAVLFSSLVIFQVSTTAQGQELRIYPIPQSQILEKGLLLDIETWWKTAPIMIGNGESMTQSEVVGIIANQDGGGHEDLKMTK